MPILIESPSQNDEEYLQDFPPGPLDIYRKQATFDRKTMKLVMEKEKVLKFKVNMQI